MYLWVNLADLHGVETIPGMGSPLNLMILEGDEMMQSVFHHASKIDEVYVVIKTPRHEEIKGGLDVIGERKIGRVVRTRVTVNKPTKSWRRSSHV